MRRPIEIQPVGVLILVLISLMSAPPGIVGRAAKMETSRHDEWSPRGSSGAPASAQLVTVSDESQATSIATASIRGRVARTGDGAPLRRVLVTAEGSSLVAVAMTGADGRYHLDHLPAGRYMVTASRQEYVTVQYGQTRLRQHGRPLELAPGQFMDEVNFALPRGSVIWGELVDEFGDPVVGARVRAEALRYIDGELQLTAAGFGGPTDDLGRFRVFGLPAGDYYMSALPLATSASPAQASTEAGTQVRYVRTYYPGTLFANAATAVRVGFDDEAGPFAWPLMAARVATLSGTITGARRSAPVRVRLRPIGDRLSGTAMSDARTTLSYDGTFRFTGVLPGWHTITAVTSLEPAPWVAMADVLIAGSDVTDLTLTLTQPSKVHGRVVLEQEAMAPTPRPDQIRVRGFSATGRDATIASVDEDWTFALPTLTELQVLRVTAPSPWRLERIISGAADVTDDVLDLSRIVDALIVTLTAAPTEVTGGVVDMEGRPVSDYVVLLFGEDPAQWARHSRFLAVGRPDQRGMFRVRGLPAGSYLATALGFLEAGREFDPNLLEQLQSVATPVQVRDGATHALELTLVE